MAASGSAVSDSGVQAVAPGPAPAGLAITGVRKRGRKP